MRLPALWRTLGEGWPTPPGTCQDESITLRLIASSDTGCSMAWEAVFDLASSMDRTRTRAGQLNIAW